MPFIWNIVYVGADYISARVGGSIMFGGKKTVSVSAMSVWVHGRVVQTAGGYAIRPYGLLWVNFLKIRPSERLFQTA
ncbi:hypothetical protein [Neisseria montereyensis]|uniref:Uncharacterized protein n=1 Tax=Neisseria montereyensis TaxID=2973938 RepID=A0ABT2FES7_9NEIS|nr:hypothetical protein [Neisseria montereyensis]MCS4534015.1 hypothetical protein [Neisseria montereyensis]